MNITWDDFDKIWAASSPLTPYTFSDLNYAAGWNFIGATPPARQMWDSLQKANDEKFKFLRDNFGTPNMVTTAAEMTDTDKIYVYVGSEVGWNNGHWYYYDVNTSAWVDGGVYNSTAFVTDTTLTEAGKAADAKAVGDALALKADLAGATFTGNVAVNAYFSTTGDATVASDLTVSGATTLADITAGDIIADDVTANGNLSVVGNATLNGTSTAVTPAVDDNSTKVATTEYVQTEIKPIETDVTINDKRITNIEKLLQGNLYDYDTDDDTAYTKTVPSGAMPYAGLEQIGGKTLVWNQLFDTLSSPLDGGGYAPNGGQKVIKGHTYLLLQKGMTSGWIRLYTRENNENQTFCRINYPGTSVIDIAPLDGVADGAANHNGGFWLYGGQDVTQLQLFDLTLMFGAGNEPSTVAEFEAMFPASYYAYNAGSLLSAGVTSVISKDSSNNILQTYSIPAEVQALTGYGWSAGTAHNYVDFERKVYVQEVGSRAYASGDESDSTVITDGTTTYYPLNPAVETDISAYLTDDNLINVEANGTLTFPNQHGDDYLLPVPSDVTYMIDLQEALS